MPVISSSRKYTLSAAFDFLKQDVYPHKIRFIRVADNVYVHGNTTQTHAEIVETIGYEFDEIDDAGYIEIYIKDNLILVCLNSDTLDMLIIDYQTRKITFNILRPELDKYFEGFYLEFEACETPDKY